MKSLLSLLVLGFLALASALSTSGNRLLVILEESSEKDKYSKFLGDLEARGFSLSYESPKNEKLSLFELGERAYDHLIILPIRSKGFGPNLTPKILLDFVKAEGNILLTLSADIPTPSTVVSLLLELDIHLPADRNALVVDHFNHDVLSSAEKHDVVILPRPDPIRPDVRNYFAGSQMGEVIVFPRGIGQTLGNERALLAPILVAQRTSYSYNPKDETDFVEDPFAVGLQLSLVSAIQALNSARFTVVGSAEMLEDKWFDGKVKNLGPSATTGTVNRAFAKEVSGWTFKEIGVVKAGNVRHFLDEKPGATANSTNPKMYRVKNTVTYSVDMSEYSWDKLIPFVPEEEDIVQLEFSMLSPFHRLTLSPSSTSANSTTYTTTFKLPDQHGIFNFMLDYKRPFLTNIEQKDTVTVRHFAHDEFPRSWAISGAWPWIAGIGVTIGGWIVFVALWLWSAPVPTKNLKKIQ